MVFELANKFNLLDSATTKYDKFLFIVSDGNVLPNSIGDKLMNLAVEIVECYKDELKTYTGSLGSFFVEK